MMYRMNKADAAFAARAAEGARASWLAAKAFSGGFAARAAEGARASWLAAKAFSGGPSGHSVIRIQETK